MMYYVLWIIGDGGAIGNEQLTIDTGHRAQGAGSTKERTVCRVQLRYNNVITYSGPNF